MARQQELEEEARVCRDRAAQAGEIQLAGPRVRGRIQTILKKIMTQGGGSRAMKMNVCA